jgi:type III pantothenate kinase
MKLLIDAGNTRIKWAFVKGDEWLRRGVLPIEQVSELAQHLNDISQVQQIWVSNVAGKNVAQAIRALGSRPINFISAREMQCGVRNNYASTTQLGSDRWAALIAAWHLLGQACLVVNCGTATTVDALTNQGEFMGGLILPSVAMMQRSLVEGTAQLKTGLGEYAAFPLNTADAILSGAIQASCGAIQRQHDLLKNDAAPILLSGGASAMLLPHLNNLPIRESANLVLQGLGLIAYEANA